MNAPVRRKVPRATREEQMLDAAEQAFAERGFHAASMDEIGAAVGVSKRMLYMYFASKEGLYIACMDRARERLFEQIERAAAREGTPAERFRSGTVAFFQWVSQHRRGWSVLFGQAAKAGPFADVVAGIRRRNAQAVVRLVRAAAAAEGLAPPEPQQTEQLAYAHVGACEALADWWMAHPDVSAEDLALVLERSTGRGFLDLIRSGGSV